MHILTGHILFSLTNPPEIMYSLSAVLCAKLQKHSSNKMIVMGERYIAIFHFKTYCIGLYWFVWVSDSIQTSCSIIEYRFRYPQSCGTLCLLDHRNPSIDRHGNRLFLNSINSTLTSVHRDMWISVVPGTHIFVNVHVNYIQDDIKVMSHTSFTLYHFWQHDVSKYINGTSYKVCTYFDFCRLCCDLPIPSLLFNWF